MPMIEEIRDLVADVRVRSVNPRDPVHVKTHPESWRCIGDCDRWPDLKRAYYDYYQDLYRPGLSIPSWVLETIRKWYKSPEGGSSNIGAFAERVIKMFF